MIRLAENHTDKWAWTHDPDHQNKTLEWYTAAAVRGHTGSMDVPATADFSGAGVPRSREEAVRWLEKAAERGHSTARFQLESMTGYRPDPTRQRSRPRGSRDGAGKPAIRELTHKPSREIQGMIQGRMLPPRVRTIFASDLHMGHRWSRFGDFHALLKAMDEPEHLYLVGDVIDGWSFRRGWSWTQDNNNLVRKILSLAKHGCQVHYAVGNHDEFLLHYVGQEFGQLRVVREAVHTTADGRRFLVVHGDQFDLIAKAAPILYSLGDFGYAVLLRANVAVNAVRRVFRRPHWSLSAWAKQRTKKMVNFLSDYENLITRYAAAKGCQGVIAGHTHTPVIKAVNGVLYCNCGDFQEQATVIVEHLDGRLELLDVSPDRWPALLPAAAPHQGELAAAPPG